MSVECPMARMVPIYSRRPLVYGKPIIAPTTRNLPTFLPSYLLSVHQSP